MAEYVKDPCLTEIFAFWPEEDKETIQEYKNVKKISHKSHICALEK